MWEGKPYLADNQRNVVFDMMSETVYPILYIR